MSQRASKDARLSTGYAAALVIALALAGCAAVPVEIIEPVSRREPAAPADKCYERARHYQGMVEVPCANIAEETRG